MTPPGLLTKTSWFVTVSQTIRLIRLSTVKSKSEVTTNGKQLSKKLYTSKVKHTQRSNQKAEKSSSIATNIHTCYHFTLIMLKEHSTTQSMNTIEYRTVSENLSKGNIIYRREITNDKYRKISHT